MIDNSFAKKIESESQRPELSSAQLEEAIKTAVSIVRNNLAEYGDSSQSSASFGGKYKKVANDQWTSGFWPGELWLCYELDGGKDILSYAEKQVDMMADRIERKVSVDHHDMGFLYTPSCVSAWKIQKNEKARNAAVLAAKQLVSRFQEKGQFIQAWGEMGNKDNYRYIIDCLLNTPLLYWASLETGDESYADIARRHTATCMANSVRPDGSTFHTFFMDMDTGAPLYGRTCQGYSDSSVWARGQAWAVYGSALAYRYDRKSEYKDVFKKTCSFFADRLPGDLIPYWDMIFNDDKCIDEDATKKDGREVKEPRDSSSASIFVCGLLEMAGLCEAEEAKAYIHQSKVIMRSLWENYAVKNGDEANGLVLHGTYSKKSPYNTCTPEGVDECVSWGDYFYLEALARLSFMERGSRWNAYW